MKEMFCFQCEQTAGVKGCSGKAGVCGKQNHTANIQDELTVALIELAQVANEYKKTKDTDRLMLEGLFTTVTNVSFDDESTQKLIEEIKNVKDSLLPEGYKDKFDFNFNMSLVWNDDEDIRSLKSLILFGVRGMAAYAYHAYVIDYIDREVLDFLYKAMIALRSNLSSDKLFDLVLEAGKINLKCMELLDRANTESYGIPKPVFVPLEIKKGPFIVISGHDLLDLKLLLEQTMGKGINIYTHGEMLPAHGYPKLKEYPHLKGNFGTAWQNQQKEFENIPAPILFTTNCIMPVKDSYRDRVFTTNVVAYPGMKHIDSKKDFTPVIEKSLELAGYNEEHIISGINGGIMVSTGFSHGFILSVADKVIEGVKSGAIKHIFLVGGCDGAKTGRNYYTDFVKKTPKDTIILTLGCGKYRFNDLELGEIDGIPRLMDMGQCNDAYSAIKIALTLAEVFNCSVNELPLTLVLSWYEQKAVAVLLTLLSLDIKNILIGPSLPAFVSKNILNVLVEKYNLIPISKAEEDLNNILTHI